MSGHSKWHNIQRTKGVADAKKGNLFSKISKDIYIAAKLGGGDVNNNPILRDVVKRAKEASMSNDKIQNAIDKANGKSSSGEKLYERTYEVLGIGGAANFLIDCLTDNPNRVLNELKELIYKNGGKIVSEGSISSFYSEFVIITISLKNQINKEEVELSILEIEGVEDIEDFTDEEEKEAINILVKKQNNNKVLEALKQNQKITIDSYKVAKIANNIIDLDNDTYDRNEALIDKILATPEVEEVWKNYK